MEIPRGNALHSYLYLKLAKMSCFCFFSFLFEKSEYRKEEQVLPRVEGGTSGRGRWWGKGVGG
jgi:hypothetical protein